MFGIPEDTRANQTLPYAPIPQIVAIGDSFTAYGQQVWLPDSPRNAGIGWVAYLTHYFHLRADVVTRGFPGYDTRCVLAALPAALGGLASSKLTVFVIFLGTNDAKFVGDNQVKAQDFKRNLRKICVIALGSTRNAMCAFVTPPPILDKRVNTVIFQNNETEAYAEIVRAVAKESNFPLIDLNTELEIFAAKLGGLKKFFVSDGIHLNGRGNEFVGRFMHNSLQDHFVGLRPKGKWFPEFGDVQNQLDREDERA